MMNKNSWIRSPQYDSLFVLLPPFICLLLIAIFPSFFVSGHMNEWTWFILIVCIDVGHVYSTLYRTYLDRSAIKGNEILYYLSPLVLYILGVILHSIEPLFFWRVLAYFAVFHFVRQQYGFMKLYARNEPQSKWSIMDTVVIYAATIYPLLHWHITGPGAFNWFVENDFLYTGSPALLPLLGYLYIVILLVYVLKELVFSIRRRSFNIPKNMLILGTVMSWYFGIVYFRGDLTFTLLNVVSHGVPYYALIWAYGNKAKKDSGSFIGRFFKPRYLAIFFLLLFLFAYSEELLWDGLIWKEHFSIFPTSWTMPDISGNAALMSVLVPLLALPQILHYFIDGFIWKIRKDRFGWVSSLFK